MQVHPATTLGRSEERKRMLGTAARIVAVDDRPNSPTLVYLTGSMRCSYGVPAHMTYGFAVSGFASRG